MQKKILLMVFFLLWTVPVLADIDTAWVREYKGPADGRDEACAVALDDCQQVYVTGKSVGDGTGNDFATVKYDQHGDTVWVRRYDGPKSEDDWPRDMVVDDSGNVYVAGTCDGSGYDPGDFVTVKYRPNGDTAWVRTYNGTKDSTDEAYAITVDDSGYVYVTGRSAGLNTEDDYLTIKYRPDGDTAWIRRYDGPGVEEWCLGDRARAIAVDGDGNVYVSGHSCVSGTGWDYCTIRYYPDGDTAWVRRYAGPGNSDDWVNAMAIDDHGNVCVTGSSYGGSGTGADIATVKYRPNGDTAWVRRYDGPGNYSDVAFDAAADGFGNVYVTGRCNINGDYGYDDFVTIRYDSSGTERWARTYEGPGKYSDCSNAIAIDDSGNAYVTGEITGAADKDIATIMYDSSGVELWVERYDGAIGGSEYAQAIAVDTSGCVYVTGYGGAYPDNDYVTIKYVQTGSGVADETGSRTKPSEFTLSQNYPNPFNQGTKIEFTLARPAYVYLNIYDLLGRKIKTLVSQRLTSGYKSVLWDGKSDSGKEVASGIYFYQLRVEDFSETKKLVLLK